MLLETPMRTDSPRNFPIDLNKTFSTPQSGGSLKDWLVKFKKNIEVSKLKKIKQNKTEDSPSPQLKNAISSVKYFTNKQEKITLILMDLTLMTCM